MQRPYLMIGAVILFLALALGGGYLFFRDQNPATGSQPENGTSGSGNLPAAIKSFTVEGRNFVVKGENLARVDIWAVRSGAETFLGAAQNDKGTWTLPIPVTARGASAIFARGYDGKGVAVAKIDLLPADLQKL